MYRECRGTASSSFVSGRDCRSTVKVIGQQEWRASQLIGSFGERVWLRWCLREHWGRGMTTKKADVCGNVTMKPII